MAKRRGGRGQRVMRQQFIDATPERLAKGDEFEFIDPAKIDSSEQAIGHVRRFRASHLDRLHIRGSVTGTQYDAGDWYRNQYARSRFALSCVASYGERTSANEPSYGLPRTEAQARARQLFRQARDCFAPADRSFMDKLLLDNEILMPGGRISYRNLNRIRLALGHLAAWLLLPIDELPRTCESNVIVASCAKVSRAA